MQYTSLACTECARATRSDSGLDALFYHSKVLNLNFIPCRSSHTFFVTHVESSCLVKKSKSKEKNTWSRALMRSASDHHCSVSPSNRGTLICDEEPFVNFSKKGPVAEVLISASVRHTGSAH